VAGTASSTDASVYIVHMNVGREVDMRSHQRTDYNLYEGWELTGYPEKVYLRGQMIVDGGEGKGRKGMGQVLKRGEGEVI